MIKLQILRINGQIKLIIHICMPLEKNSLNYETLESNNTNNGL